MQENTKYRVILILGLIGLAIASLTGLSERVAWISSLCHGVSGACVETARITLAGQPIWSWGIAYFALLVLLAAIGGMRRLVLWLVAAGVGFELVLVSVMIARSWLCVFCIGNLVIMTLLTFAAFDRGRFWQALSVALLVLIVVGAVIPLENELGAFAAGKAEQNEVLARVAGKELTESQIVGPNASKILDLEREIYRMKQQRLQELVAELLLQEEAASRGITVQQLINDEVLSKGITITDEEVDQYIRDNSNRLAEWRGTQEELKNRVKAALQQEKSYQKVLEFTKALESKYKTEIYLKEPQPFLAKVNIEGSPSIGPQDAPVVVAEFSDYECPSCRGVHDTVKKVREAYQGKVLWVFKDYPLKRHEHAQLAAEAAWCAREQDKYWQYQDLLYGSKDPLTADRLKELAKQLGLNAEKFNQCLDSGKYKATVEKQMEDAKKAGVDRTPTFIINGRLITGAMPFENFKQIIDEELAKAEK